MDTFGVILEDVRTFSFEVLQGIFQLNFSPSERSNTGEQQPAVHDICVDSDCRLLIAAHCQ